MRSSSLAPPLALAAIAAGATSHTMVIDAFAPSYARPTRIRSAAAVVVDDETTASASSSTVVVPPAVSSSSSSSSAVTTFDNVSSTFLQEQSSSSLPSDSTKSWTDDGFVFGLQGSGLERPKGRVASLVVENDSLTTQPYQVAMVAITFASHLAFAAASIAHMVQLHNGNVFITFFQTLLVVTMSWIVADFGSGVFHWSVDNYGNGKTPVMGSMIAAFQGHHAAPWTIGDRGFCNNVYKLCVPFGPVTVAPLYWLLHEQYPSVTLFVTTFCALEVLSQEFHKWSHQLKSQVPAFVNVLQKAGITIARGPHAQHHLAPYDGNYCIISGVCNEALDESGFFRRLEHAIYKLNGVESNAWKLDASLRERTLRGEYGLVEK